MWKGWPIAFFVGPRSAPVNTSWGTTLDVNGDGLADVLVGAQQASNGGGAAYLYLAGNGGLSSTPMTLSSPAGPSGYFGSSVASAGDVNGDGSPRAVRAGGSGPPWQARAM